jgi:CubicO group peptidase (beta-lactamase class C family)
MVAETDDLSEKLRNHIKSSIPEVSHGMTVLVAKADKKLFFESYGKIDDLHFTYSNDTVYDLASLTKPLATSTLAFKLIDSGKLSMEDTASSLGLFSGMDNLGKLSVKSLLSHSSGLTPSLPLYRRGKTRESYLAGINDAAASAIPYVEENYSDLNYILLGYIIEEICGKSLDKAWKSMVAAELGLKHSMYLPKFPRDRIAPTESDRSRGQVWGEVHDENSFYSGGVAGHAGLFSDASDIFSFASQYIKGKIISKASLLKATRPANEYIGGSFGYGWMINTPRPARQSPAFDYARFIGDIAPFGAFGHTGFTGTSIMIDPGSSIIVIILSNRVYPTRENIKILKFRRTFHNLVFSSLLN